MINKGTDIEVLDKSNLSNTGPNNISAYIIDNYEKYLLVYSEEEIENFLCNEYCSEIITENIKNGEEKFGISNGTVIFLIAIFENKICGILKGIILEDDSLDSEKYLGFSSESKTTKIGLIDNVISSKKGTGKLLIESFEELNKNKVDFYMGLIKDNNHPSIKTFEKNYYFISNISIDNRKIFYKKRIDKL